MAWDLSLLRKFSNTSHFRLLKQVRNELKAVPLNRNPATGELNVQSKQNRAYSNRSSRRGNPVDIATSNQESSVGSDKDLQSTFRDRLNSVELR